MHLVNFERIDSHVPAKSAGSLGDAALGFEALEPALPGSRRIGAVIQLGPYAGTVVDLNRMLAIKLAYDDVGAPEVEANSLVPPDLFSFLGLGASALEAAQRNSRSTRTAAPKRQPANGAASTLGARASSG